MIEVYIGEQSAPLKVQESVLTNISDFFTKAIKNQHLDDSEGILHFPEDDIDGWSTLLFRKSKGRLPSIIFPKEVNERQEHLVRLLVLGDKYGVDAFQDLVMLELLLALDHTRTKLETVRMAFENAPPDSKLQMVKAEVLVRTKDLYSTESYDGFEIFESLVSFIPAMMRTTDRSHNGLACGGRRIWQKVQWMECMIGEGPKKHWVEFL